MQSTFLTNVFTVAICSLSYLCNFYQIKYVKIKNLNLKETQLISRKNTVTQLG